MLVASARVICDKAPIQNQVFIGYPGVDFEYGKKPKRGPKERRISENKSKNFLLRGANKRSWRRVRSLLKPSSVFLINRK